MKRIKKLFRVVPIDVLVYRMTRVPVASPGELPYEIAAEKGNGNTCFSVSDNGKFVHRSFLYDKIHVLKLLGKNGPAIGNCVTGEDYRGQSVYPKMIHRIAVGQLQEGKKEVFIIVNPDNTASVRGIEKAGFELYASIKARRFLLFYFDKEIKRNG